MQYQSPLISHSPSCYTCPPSGLRSKAPVFAFNTGLYDPGPNEIDPLDLSCLSDDQSSKTRASGDFTFPTHSLAIVRPPFEQQRYSSASYSSTHTPSLSDYTETPSILGSTPSPVLLRTPRSPPLLDLKYLDPLRDMRTHKLISRVVSPTYPLFQNASPLTYTGRLPRETKMD